MSAFAAARRYIRLRGRRGRWRCCGRGRRGVRSALCRSRPARERAGGLRSAGIRWRGVWGVGEGGGAGCWGEEPRRRMVMG